MMKEYFIVFILVCITFFRGYGQEIPPEYKHLITLPKPKGLKKGVPGEIVIDTTNQLIAIEYDYKPTFIEIYSMNDFRTAKRVKISGWTYLDNSYFSEDGKSLYLDNGKTKSFTKIDLKTLKKTKIACENLPKGCYFDEGMPERRSGGDVYTHYSMIINDFHLTVYKFGGGEFSIYIK